MTEPTEEEQVERRLREASTPPALAPPPVSDTPSPATSIPPIEQCAELIKLCEQADTVRFLLNSWVFLRMDLSFFGSEDNLLAENSKRG